MLIQAQRPHTTSTSILVRLRHQEPDAWSYFDTIYRPYIAGVCRGLQIADRDDVVQQVLLKVHKAIENFDRQRKGSFRAWLRTITVNLIADLCKSRDIPMPPEWFARKTQPTPEQLAEEDIALYASIADTARSIFSEKWVRCFFGMTVYGTKSTQLAKELGMTDGAVRKANFKVLKRLREELADLLEDAI